ncbi:MULTISPECIES: hypothetical protein [Filomicrobium]|uniref:Cytochrome c553 n=1 Tax=Filomicrobium insigne TaxID=418854 RepID=A0A1H0T364_9HYPH|nr:MULTISPECIES: hypothetical protein [Filomicrobium]MCV0370899.1 hypothetical protein [Filomicrobium sp.]SDP48160.1 Cytochrome c553 [Filomicrobium insigne]
MRLLCLATTMAVLGVTATEYAARAQTATNPELMAYGEYLAGECTTCHQTKSSSDGIPAITGLDTDHFVSALEAYKSGSRTNTTMISVARSLDAEQIRALAVYFGSLNPNK